MASDDVKLLILSRRARFVAAALAGAGLGVVACDTEPVVCLDIVAPGGYGGAAAGAGGMAGAGGLGGAGNVGGGGQEPTGGGGAGSG